MCRNTPYLRRKLFIVILGDHNHGKSCLVNALAQVAGPPRQYKKEADPGHIIIYCDNSCNPCYDAYFFNRAYQEKYLDEICKKLDEICKKLEKDKKEKDKEEKFERAVREAIEGTLSKVIGDEWFMKDLIVFPLRCLFPSKSNQCASCGGSNKDRDLMIARQIIEIAHGYGFDAIVAYVILEADELAKRPNCRAILALNWDKRWELCNPKIADDDPNREVKVENQCYCLARLLLRRICEELRR